MPDIYIIKGKANSRKSSTIRALTGASRSGVYDIETINGILEVFVQIPSLQEFELFPEDFIEIVRKGKFKNVLVPIRKDNPKGYPFGLEESMFKNLILRNGI